MKKYSIYYSLWISITTALYAVIYLSSPLGNYGIMWMTFVSLPIFFTAGAKLQELPHYICSMVAGIIWGIINLWFIQLIISQGLGSTWANALNLLLITIVCLVIHFVLLGETWFGKVPMLFGGLSMTFSQGGKNLLPVGMTLLCGLLLGVVFSTGGNWLEKKFLIVDNEQ